MFDAGAIVGTLQLDKGQWEASVAAVNQSFGNLEGMAKRLGLTLKTDLEKQLRDAEHALTALRGSTEATPGAIKNLESQIQKLNTQLHGTTEETEKGGLSFGKLTAAVGLGNLAYTAANKAMSFVKDTLTDSVKAALEAEDAQIALASAITSTGKQSYLSAEQFAVYASSLMEVTNQDDELIKSAQAVLIRLTKLDQEGINVATKGAIGLAYVMKMDLTQAAEVVAKAMEGNYLALNRTVPAIREAKTEGEKHAALLKYLAESYNQATDAAQAGSGPLKSLKIWWGELEEEIGGAIIKNEAVQKILGDVKVAIVDLIKSGKLAQWAQDASAVLTFLVGSLKAVADTTHLVTDASKGAAGVFQSLVNKEFQDAADRVKKFNATLLDGKTALEGENAAAMAGGKAWEDFKKAAKEADDQLQKNKGIQSVADKVAFWKDRLDDLEPSLRVARLAAGMLADAADELAKKDATAKAAKSAKEAADALEKSLEALNVKGYTKIDQQIKKVDKDMDALTKAFKAGKISTAQYEEGIKHGKEEITQLATTILTTALPAARQFTVDMTKMGPTITSSITASTTSWTEKIEAFWTKYGQFAEAAVRTFQQAIDLMDASWKNSQTQKMNDLETWYATQKALIDNSLLTEDEKNAKMTTLDADYAAKKKELQKKEFEHQKAIQIANAIIGTASAVISAASTQPFFPLGLAMMALATLLGTAELIIIEGQTMPLAKGGILNRPTFSSDGRFLAGEVRPELVGDYGDIKRDIRDIVSSEVARAVGGNSIRAVAGDVYLDGEKVGKHIVRIVGKASRTTPFLSTRGFKS